MDECSNVRCGPNAECINGQCQCLPEYHGDPYFNCRPECVLSTDCDQNKACIRRKCVDPCVGVCGQNAICLVVNHIPMCSCVQGFSGNAFVGCNPVKGTFIYVIHLFVFMIVSMHRLTIYTITHFILQRQYMRILVTQQYVGPTANVEW